MTTTSSAPRSEHVAVSRMTLLGGGTYEVITISRDFLKAALEDARSWCGEVETPWGLGRTAGNMADYDAALAVVNACVADTPAQLLPVGDQED